jgi:hypothetical protein
MIRYFAAALAIALSLSFVSTDAFAGKNKPDAGGEAPAADPYAIPEMKATKIPDVDSFFESAKAPITSVVNSRKMVDGAHARINTALGLGADITLADAL